MDEWINDFHTTLGNKISKITNNRTQTLATATYFNSNDGTHYNRRHPEHDFDSMKDFKRVLLSEIENEIEYEKRNL